MMRCSGDLLGEAPLILHRDGVTNRYSNMETHCSLSFIRSALEHLEVTVARHGGPIGYQGIAGGPPAAGICFC